MRCGRGPSATRSFCNNQRHAVAWIDARQPSCRSIFPVREEVEFLLHRKIDEIAFDRSRVRAPLRTHEFWYADRGQQADDHHDHEQFDKGETGFSPDHAFRRVAKV